MSDIEQFIATKQYDFDGRGMLVIDADDLREFMKGKTVVDTSAFHWALNKCPMVPASLEYAALIEQALQPNTGEKPGE